MGYTENNFSESKALEALIQDRNFTDILGETSSSEEDALNRIKVYSDVMSKAEEARDMSKMFSGYSELPLRGLQFFDASMASFVRSYAGFLTVERSMDQATALLWYNDVLGVTDNRKVLQNIGKENLKGINSRFSASNALQTGTTEYSVSTNKKLIPGSVEIQLIHKADPNKPVKIKDDSNGNLLAPAGVLAANADGRPSVNYLTGSIQFKIGDGFTIAEGDVYSLVGSEDVAGDPVFGQLTGPGNNRFKLDYKPISITTEPDLLIGESDLMTTVAAQKSIGRNPQQILAEKLTEIYTKLINNSLAEGIKSGSTGNKFEINMTNYISRFTDYQSRLDSFQSDLVNIDTLMAEETRKATKATCYLVGTGMGNWFRKLRNTGNWVDNKESTYINDLLGYYNGVPVLIHDSISRNTGYACHKVPTGEVAPLMRGIFLPLTSTPLVGNYNKPVQMAQGIFYQEANKLIFPELIQEFSIKDADSALEVKQVS